MSALRVIILLLPALLWGKPKALPIEHFTAHPQMCRSCHEKQFDFQQTTKHSSAYLVLYLKSQHLDPECIGCHTLGFKHPGGFQKTKDTIVGTATLAELFQGIERNVSQLEKLRSVYLDRVHKLESEGKIQKIFQGVQCEHCHGVRGVHPGGAKSKKVDVKSCKTCHIPDRSPNFSPDWIAKVACPKR